MDRRVKKTQAAIRNAFTDLIKEKGDVNSITIKEIVDRADISRSTFYTHYTDINELIDDLSNMLADDIAKIVVETHKKTTGISSYMMIYRSILSYLYEKGPVSKAILVDARNTRIIEEISKSLRDGIAAYYKTTHRQMDSELLFATATFWTNGILGIMREWAQYDFKYSVDEMTTIITKAIETCSTFFREG